MWILWILASSVFLAFYDLAKKASVRENAVLPVLLMATMTKKMTMSVIFCICTQSGF